MRAGRGAGGPWGSVWQSGILAPWQIAKMPDWPHEWIIN
jgi:hypothetical protein